MFFELQLCETNGLNNIIVEADSKLLTTYVNREANTPWRMLEAVESIREIVEEKRLTVQYYYRETNKLADKLASLSLSHRNQLVFTRFDRLPRMVSGLV